MADDPITVSSTASAVNLGPGCRKVILRIAGPADYDATNGSAFDLTSYLKNRIDNVTISAVDAKADALLLATYVNDDLTDLDGGAVYFTWSAAGTSAALFGNVADTTDLSGYVFQCTIEGE